ncbi:MAG TPA: hypothetical protein VHE13_16310 [Opitutus sp.]|nr:hypothetical protein [Opitutus sp.]
MIRPIARLRAFALLLAALTASAAEPPSTYVDDHGILRWTATKAEVVQFGVNYTTPFAHAFRVLQRTGIPWQQAIDTDVYHFARLGFDAYRVHMWDRQISDADGNLLVNEHMLALDYLLAKLKERGIKIILTPLQFGDAGYPEGGQPLPGFSSRYGKKGCLEDQASWPLQERYLAQLMNHVNPHTGVAYKNDPDILAFEICNEPGHFDYQLTLDYINRMVKAVRDTGCAKPIFYNMSHGLPVAQAYLDANVQGGTFQWYPSNLVAGHEQRGNFLPYVDDYPIPFADNPKFKTKAKMFYEFDSADIGRSYIYPAMARSFRKVGAQFATQFAYDGLYVAPSNTEYQTHYLNLAYAPQKALSMKIAGEAFRRVPLYHDYGRYPDDTSFAGVHVGYEDDLAELVTENKFFYTNRTTTKPPAPGKLEHIAGYGTSPIVDYPGQGAYFLDRIAPGVWRLEVMPDAIWVRDPFEKASPHKQVSRIAWNDWPMRVDLPDLGASFRAAGLNAGNAFSGRANDRTLTVHPGVYLLTRDGVTTQLGANDKYENITLGEFVAPPPSVDRTYVLHTPVVEASAGENLHLAATVVSPDPIEEVEVVAYLPGTGVSYEETIGPGQRQMPGRGNTPGPGRVYDGGARTFAMHHVSGFLYAVDIPGDQLQPGPMRYQIAVKHPSGWVTFPSDIPVAPTAWDFYGHGWNARIVPANAPVLLFAAADDVANITADHRDIRPDLVPSDRPGTSAMEYVADDLTEDGHDYSFRFFFKDKVAARTASLAGKTNLVFYGKSATDQPCPLQLALVTTDGIAYGATVEVKPESGKYTVPVSALKQVRSPNIPHGYPVFLHFWSDIQKPIPFDLSHAESVLVSIGPGVAPETYAEKHGVDVERIWLE